MGDTSQYDPVLFKACDSDMRIAFCASSAADTVVLVQMFFWRLRVSRNSGAGPIQ